MNGRISNLRVEERDRLIIEAGIGKTRKRMVKFQENKAFSIRRKKW